MSVRTFFESLILFILSICVFWLIEKLFIEFIPLPEIFALIIILIVLNFFHSDFRLIIRRLINREYHFRISTTQAALETLNIKLNHAIRYHEVTKLLAETFTTIFEDNPHAFYILENDKYYLVHYAFLDEHKSLIKSDFKYDIIKNIPIETLKIPDLSQTSISAQIQKELLDSGLNTIFPFRGHSQIFALLLVDDSKINFKKDLLTQKLFEKIQKKAGLILENSALFVDLERKNFETKKLIEVSQKILSSLDTKQILDFILDSLQSIIQFDAASIFLMDEASNKLLNASSLGYDESIVKKLHLKVGEGSCGWVVKTKEIDVLDDVRGAKHYYEIRPETRSQISIPLIFDRHVLGVICLESDHLSYFDDNLVEILRLFAHLAAIAVHNARQFEIGMAKQALEHELINASTVQQRLLVHQFPSIENLKITALNIPSKIVSGDLYDVIKFNEYTAGIAIGDVSGKGAPAALMMTLILAGLRSQKKTFLTVCDIVYRLNNLLFESITPGKYATFFYSILLMDSNKLIYTNAGHNPPILVKDNGEIQKLSEGGIVLGFKKDYEYHQEEVEFHSGDTLIAYTDGVTEALNDLKEEFGEERLMELIKNNWQKPVFELKECIINAVSEYTNNSNPSDDITLIICKHN